MYYIPDLGRGQRKNGRVPGCAVIRKAPKWALRRANDADFGLPAGPRDASLQGQ
jgi:hypothetical protein